MKVEYEEIWVPILGYEGLYEVSNYGRVRSLDRLLVRGNKTYKAKGVLLAVSLCGHGYAKVNLWKDKQQKTAKNHILVARHFIGECPDGMEVCHCDGDRSNPMLHNLRYDTRSGNFADKKIHGTDGTGERHSQASISNETAYEIMVLLLRGHKIKDIANMHQIGSNIVSSINTDKNWSHISPPPGWANRKVRRRTDVTVVKKIKTLLLNSDDAYAIAQECGVNVSVVRAIMRGVAWNHIKI